MGKEQEKKERKVLLRNPYFENGKKEDRKKGQEAETEF